MGITTILTIVLAAIGGILIGWVSGHKMKKNKLDIPLALHKGALAPTVIIIGLALFVLAYYLGSSTDIIIALVALLLVHFLARKSLI